MPIGILIAFLLGIAVEIALLFERSNMEPPAFAPRIAHQIDQRIVIIVPCVLAALVAYLAVGIVGELNTEVSLDDEIIGAIFVGIGLMALFYGFISVDLLPSVSEQNVAVVHLIVLISLILNGIPAVDRSVSLALFIVPSLILLYLGISQRTLRPTFKALVYFWYLILLMIVAAQNDLGNVFNALDLTLFEGFTAGMIFIFLLLHGLFFLRFFLIVSSLIIPRNRPSVAPLMTHLYSDRQLPPARFLLLVVIAAGLLLLMIGLNIFPEQTAINLAVLFGAQVILK